MTPDSPRPGDVVNVRATVKQSRTDRAPYVEFKNGDSLPLTSVEVAEVTQYAIKIGDKIRIDANTASEVMAVFLNVTPPQVAHRVPGNWPIRVDLLEKVTRLNND